MKKHLFGIIFLAALCLFVSGCLTCEQKQYIFKIHEDHTVTLTIRYINIMLTPGDSITKDSAYRFLVEEYVNGDRVDADFPDASNFKKRLFEENGVLCGEVSMDFPNLEAAGIFQYDPNGPYMVSMTSLGSEEYSTSNGGYPGEKMPVVFWDNKLDELQVTTLVEKNGDPSYSLLDVYRQVK
ncbi:MAG TPA: hypothetical protein VMC08_01470 [Bacteroidales bacterium]|nr:hypothetical protein [Bacteroidales bacterium]